MGKYSLLPTNAEASSFVVKKILSLSLAALCIGCGDSTPEPVAPPPPAAVSVTPDAGTAAAPPAAAVTPPPASGATAPAEPGGPAESAPMDATSQEKILAAMQSYVIDNSANPKSLEELVAKRYLKSLPPAPEGKKWVYNPEKLNIEAVNK